MKLGLYHSGSGRQLRSEDPASMKDIVSTIQEKIKGKENGLT